MGADLLVGHFCVTVPHARSVSYRAAFGTAADPQQRARVEQLYETFKQEMYDKYGYRYVPPPASAVGAPPGPSGSVTTARS
ncbi:hypothetical protein PLESTF_000098800 [Pleodorina starrii]|nr:hypothetical protein PLESTF_000098800 [Pleodorina starrii]